MNPETLAELFSISASDQELAPGVSFLSLPPRGPTVYALTRGREIVYVGQTFDLVCRLGQHRQNGKAFDGVLYAPVLRTRMNLTERELIRILKPSLNTSEHFRPGPQRRTRRSGYQHAADPLWLVENGAYWRATIALPNGKKRSKSLGRIHSKSRSTAYREAIAWAEIVRSGVQKEGSC